MKDIPLSIVKRYRMRWWMQPLLNNIANRQRQVDIRVTMYEFCYMYIIKMIY
jgi:hypothetical protein